MIANDVLRIVRHLRQQRFVVAVALSFTMHLLALLSLLLLPLIRVSPRKFAKPIAIEVVDWNRNFDSLKKFKKTRQVPRQKAKQKAARKPRSRRNLSRNLHRNSGTKKRIKAAENNPQSINRLIPSAMPHNHAEWAAHLQRPISASSANSELEAGDYYSGQKFRAGDASQFLQSSSDKALQYIYRRIEQNLGFPRAFASQKMQGNVVAVLRFDREGRYLSNKSSFQSSSRYFRIYVLRLIESLFKGKRLPGHFVKNFSDGKPKDGISKDGKPKDGKFKNGKPKNKAYTISALFAFAITEHNDEQLIAAQQQFGGSVMRFFRNSHQSVLQYKVGPLSGIIGAPIAALDLLWFPRKIVEMTSAKVKITPLTRFEIDPKF